MQKIAKKLKIFFTCVILSFSSALTLASNELSLLCKVNETEDYFEVDLNQLIYTSNEFLYYQMIEGLSVLIMNKNTLRFNRLSNLNLLENSSIDPSQPPDNHQFFNGLCEYQETKF